MRNPLDDSVQFLKGVGPGRAADFARLDIHTVRDLLFTFPRDLSDRSSFSTIADAPVGREVAIVARPVDVRQKKLRRGKVKTVTIVQFTDDTGLLEAVWFNSPWVLDKFQGEPVMLFGKTKFEFGMLKMEHPQFELVPGANVSAALSIGRIVPLYPCTGGLTQNVWRRVMMHALETRLPELEELYPDSFLKKRDFPDRRTAVRNMHFPENPPAQELAQARLMYDECLLMQLTICRARRRYRQDAPGRSFRLGHKLDARIRRLFPFRLTPAQDRTIKEISADMESPRPMHRLLQGDVGSGKTVVALYAMLAAISNKAQVCIMAPTTLLARQHFHTITSFLAHSKHSQVHLALLVGGLKKPERSRLLTRLAAGAVDILIATHSALQEDIGFKDLGLVVIDEQHKFGVRQRAKLPGKGARPDVLVMTATPIPRSLALTVFGDLDISVIDELPPGRKGVKTSAPSPAKEPEVWKFLRRELTKGRQAYVVSPLVEESEKLDLRSATEVYESLRQKELAGFRLALLHGRIGREEQGQVMERFRRGQLDALVSTVVIEVGVDIPNATVMVVLHAERFGLAQLHQLRGRIGRGPTAGHFFLLSGSRTEEARRRLGVLCRTSDGFKIAEEDLLMRGPGELLGARQHGLPDLKLVDIVRDISMIRKARKDAEKILEADPGLERPSHRAIRLELERLLAQRGSEVGIG